MHRHRPNLVLTVTGRADRGINVFMLASQSYESTIWLTYKQAAERGGHVKAGEKATPVVLWKWLDRSVDAED